MASDITKKITSKPTTWASWWSFHWIAATTTTTTTSLVSNNKANKWFTSIVSNWINFPILCIFGTLALALALALAFEIEFKSCRTHTCTFTFSNLNSKSLCDCYYQTLTPSYVCTIICMCMRSLTYIGHILLVLIVTLIFTYVYVCVVRGSSAYMHQATVNSQLPTSFVERTLLPTLALFPFVGLLSLTFAEFAGGWVKECGGIEKFFESLWCWCCSYWNPLLILNGRQSGCAPSWGNTHLFGAFSSRF